MPGEPTASAPGRALGDPLPTKPPASHFPSFAAGAGSSRRCRRSGAAAPPRPSRKRPRRAPGDQRPPACLPASPPRTRIPRRHHSPAGPPARPPPGTGAAAPTRPLRPAPRQAAAPSPTPGRPRPRKTRGPAGPHRSPPRRRRPSPPGNGRNGRLAHRPSSPPRTDLRAPPLPGRRGPSQRHAQPRLEDAPARPARTRTPRTAPRPPSLPAGASAQLARAGRGGAGRRGSAWAQPSALRSLHGAGSGGRGGERGRAAAARPPLRRLLPSGGFMPPVGLSRVAALAAQRASRVSPVPCGFFCLFFPSKARPRPMRGYRRPSPHERPVGAWPRSLPGGWGCRGRRGPAASQQQRRPQVSPPKMGLWHPKNSLEKVGDKLTTFS